MSRKTFCRKSLVHSVVSNRNVRIKYLLICCLMLQVTDKFLFLSFIHSTSASVPSLKNICFKRKDTHPDLWRFFPTGHHWHIQTYTCNKAVVADEGCLRKLLTLTMLWELLLLLALQTGHFLIAELEPQALDLIDQASQAAPHWGSSVLWIWILVMWYLKKCRKWSCLHGIMIYKRNGLLKHCSVTIDILPQDPNSYVLTQLPAYI